MVQQMSTISWADYAVIAVTTCISMGIGMYYRFSGGRQKTTQEYFSANKSMSIVPVAIALMVSFMSAITLLGVSAENYTYGTQFFIINLSYLIGTPLVCYGYMPVFFNVGAISAYEYLEKRFGRGARVVASTIYWVQSLLYSGVVLYAPALALEATTGLNRIWSIVAIGIACAFYSTIGGIKAVLITDVFQGVLMYTSLLAIIYSAVSSAGGFSEIWRIASEGGRIEFDNISLDPTVRHTWWNLLIGGLGNFLSLYGVNQVQIQRMMTTRNLKSARSALWLSWPILTCLSALICFSGLAVYSHYYNCDPKSIKRISSMDMIMPLYVMDTLSNVPGLPGLFVAGVFSAGLSTISAELNSLAAVTLEDYIKPLYRWCTKCEFSETKSIVCSKLLVMFFGAFCIAVAFAAQFIGGVLQTSLTIFGVVGGPLLGIFTLGMLVESANQIGAVIGTVISFVFCLWIAFGQPRPTPSTLPVSTEGCAAKTIVNYVFNTSVPVTELLTSLKSDSYFYLYRISYMWYSVIGFTIVMVIGFVVSHISCAICKKYNNDVNPDLFFPFIARRIKKRQREDNINGNINSNSLYVFDGKYDDSPKYRDQINFM